MKNFTLADAIGVWKESTGEPGKSVDKRVRALRDSGFLNSARHLAEAHNITSLTVGLMAGENLSEAPEIAMRLIDAVCVQSTGEPHPIFQPGTTLDTALSVAFRLVKRRELTVHNFKVSICGTEIGASLSVTGKGGTVTDALFFVDDEQTAAMHRWPIMRTMELHGNALHNLAELVTERSTALSKAELAEKVAQYAAKSK